MTNEQKYNGWTNYETWNVKLWLDNDGTVENIFKDQAQTFYNEALEDNRRNRAIYILADSIKDFVEDENPLIDQANMFADMLNAALRNVNWFEIAESIFDDYVETEE